MKLRVETCSMPKDTRAFLKFARKVGVVVVDGPKGYTLSHALGQPRNHAMTAGHHHAGPASLAWLRAVVIALQLAEAAETGACQAEPAVIEAASLEAMADQEMERARLRHERESRKAVKRAEQEAAARAAAQARKEQEAREATQAADKAAAELPLHLLSEKALDELLAAVALQKSYNLDKAKNAG